MAEFIEEAAPATLHVRVRDLPWYTPLKWLKLGWGDMRAMPHGSLFYGVAFVAMGYAFKALFAHAPEETITLITAFLLAGPFCCLGLYEISRLHETVARVRLLPTFTAFRHNIGGISLFSMMLALLVAGWMRVSVVIFALFFTDDVPNVALVMSPKFLTEENLSFLIIWIGSGALFASLAFALSVVSIPLMLDRDTDTLNAIFASVRVVMANPLCMLVWAGLIVGLVGLGFAMWGVGIIVTAPLVGHATWHAYRALIE